MVPSRFNRIVITMLLAAPGLGWPAPAEQPRRPLTEESSMRTRKEDTVIRTDVRLVLVPVTVTDSAGRIVHGLSRENFIILDDKVPQPITSFSVLETPAAIGLVFDLSGSMRDKIDRARRAAQAFWATTNPDDEVFLVTFADRAELQNDFTSDFGDIQQRLLFAAARGKTALIDGIDLALRHMRNARHSRKALLVISDGGDNNSRLARTELLSIAREADVQIYGIGIHDNPHAREEADGSRLLEELSQATGGLHFVVGDAGAELRDTAAKIGAALHDQYLLGYAPPVGPDGKWRTIQVRVVSPRHWPRLQPYARRGYYAR